MRTARSPEVRVRPVPPAPADPGDCSGSIRIDGEPGGELTVLISREDLRGLARAVLGHLAEGGTHSCADECVAGEVLNQVAGALRRRADLPQGPMSLPRMGGSGTAERAGGHPREGWVGVEARAGWGRARFAFVASQPGAWEPR